MGWNSWSSLLCKIELNMTNFPLEFSLNGKVFWGRQKSLSHRSQLLPEEISNLSFFHFTLIRSLSKFQINVNIDLAKLFNFRGANNSVCDEIWEMENLCFLFHLRDNLCGKKLLHVCFENKTFVGEKPKDKLFRLH